MNELLVKVEQHPGVVQWNFDELKAALEAEMSSYETAVYDDDRIKAAKIDIASLRKLKESVEERRKEIRRKCLEPYGLIEKQAKELTGLIDKPITLIDKRIKEYEEEQRKKRREEIVKFFDGTFSDINPAVASVAKAKRYDARWENATASKKSWQEAIKSMHDSIVSDLSIIADVDEDCREASMKAYIQNLVLNEALMKANEMKRQKEAILEAERRRREAEERRRQEEERRRIEEEARRKAVVDKPVEAVDETQESAPAESVAAPIVTEEEIGESRVAYVEAARANGVPVSDEYMGGRVKVSLTVTGTTEQVQKIKGFIRYIGAEFTEA